MTDQPPKKRATHEFSKDRISASEEVRRYLAEDKRNAVLAILNDEEWVKWSDGRVAEQAGVTQPFVSDIRRQLITVMSSPAAKFKDEPKIGKDGKARKPPKKAAKKQPASGIQEAGEG